MRTLWALWIGILCSAYAAATGRSSLIEERHASTATTATTTTTVALDQHTGDIHTAHTAATSKKEATATAAQQPKKSKTFVNLLIGIKSSVIHGSQARQAIRDTWGSKLPTCARIVFLGCAPDLAPYNASEAKSVVSQLTRERDQYGDLLLDELIGCTDSYEQLVHKVMAFFQWAAPSQQQQQQPAAQNAKAYVMVTDDDIYLRADHLIEQLRHPATPATRFYAGQVWAKQYHHAMEPRRTPLSNKYYLSHAQYAMDQLPPFANGPHYILSADLAHFLGQHRDLFRGVGGYRDTGGTLDDVSVALWLLAMQVHPYHIHEFSNLRSFLCRNDVISYADLSSRGMRAIHSNLQEDRNFCDGFSYATWFKWALTQRQAQAMTVAAEEQDESLLSQWESLELSWSITLPRATRDAQITLEIDMETNTSARVIVQYAPSIASFNSFCVFTATQVELAFHLPLGRNQVYFCDKLGAHLKRVLLSDRPNNRMFFAQLLHNLANTHQQAAPHLIVLISTGVQSSRTVLDCLLAQAYPGSELLMHSEETTDLERTKMPDIVVFTATTAEETQANEGDDESVMAKVQRYVTKFAKTSRLILLTDDDPSKWPQEIDSRVIVISSTGIPKFSRHEAQLFVPRVSTSFSDTDQFSPLELLTPLSSSSDLVGKYAARQFCVEDTAHHKCGRPHRDYFFHLLNALDRVESIGTCHGHNHMSQDRDNKATTANTSLTTSSTPTPSNLDEKVSLYRDFKFVIAFEDTVNTPGVVTETLVAAFLAGSVPIYYGHSPTATSIFNSKAFIDCGSFKSLRACANHVLAVHASPALYLAMLRAAPIVDTRVFVDLFSWHPDVAAWMARQYDERERQGEVLQRRRTTSDRLKIMLDEAW